MGEHTGKVLHQEHSSKKTMQQSTFTGIYCKSKQNKRENNYYIGKSQDKFTTEKGLKLIWGGSPISRSRYIHHIFINFIFYFIFDCD